MCFMPMCNVLYELKAIDAIVAVFCARDTLLRAARDGRLASTLKEMRKVSVGVNDFLLSSKVQVLVVVCFEQVF